jgi:hypothetical protein
MIPQYNRKSLAFGFLGGLFFLGCLSALQVFGDPGYPHPPAVWILTLLAIGQGSGAALLIIGLCYYAKGKGHHPALGLLGLFCCIGWAILWFLPDKTKTPQNSSLTPPVP